MKGNNNEPSAQHKYLNVFVGKWKTKGYIKSTIGDDFLITGTDSYEWLEGGFFLKHTVDVLVAGQPVKAIEMIGYDADTKNYPMYSFDNNGNFEEMKAILENDIWTITGKDKRCTIVFNAKADTIIGKWEKLVDGLYWSPWMDMELTKI